MTPGTDTNWWTRPVPPAAPELLLTIVAILFLWKLWQERFGPIEDEDEHERLSWGASMFIASLFALTMIACPFAFAFRVLMRLPGRLLRLTSSNH